MQFVPSNMMIGFHGIVTYYSRKNERKHRVIYTSVMTSVVVIKY